MDDEVRRELADLLKSGGRNLCTMPRMLGIMLRQRCPNAEGPVRELEDALETGCVGPILAATGGVDEEALANDLAAKAGLAPERARWAIDTWVQALDASDARPGVSRDWAEWNRLDVSAATAGGGGAYRRAVWHLVIVGLAGAVGGCMFGLFILTRTDAHGPAPWASMLDDVDPWLQVPAVFALGILGGFAGGLLGWIVGGGRSWTYDAHGGTTLGRLVFSAGGAFHGAIAGTLCGVVVLGLIGITLGALLGAAIGAFLGLLIAEGISRFWW
jgi:hypothetical protein